MSDRAPIQIVVHLLAYAHAHLANQHAASGEGVRHGC